MNSPVFPFDSSITLDKKALVPVYIQLANGLIELIEKGQLKTEVRLPGSRDMAEIMGLHRKTVIAAYNELISQGWAVAKPSKGTFVINKLPLDNPIEIGTPIPGVRNIVSFQYRKREHLVHDETIYSHHLIVDEGTPDVRLAPVDIINRAYRNVVRHSYQYKHLSYANPKGDNELRAHLQSYLQATRGLNMSSEQILITRGSQMGIYLASQTLICPGNTVVVGETNYINTNLTFEDAGASLVNCAVDEDGLDTESLEQICLEKKVKLVYVTPHHHHPTTATLSATRRLHLLRLAEKYDFVILEDDYDYDFHYARSPILPLASADVQGRVIYLGGVSKLVAPVYRIGFMIGPAAYIDATARYRRIIDRQGDTLLERAFAQLFQFGDIQRHSKKALQIYRHRWQEFGNKLDNLSSGILTYERPSGGMAYWVGLNTVFHWDTVHKRLLEHKVVIPSYSKYDQHQLGHNHIRLGFASLNDDELETFFSRFSKVLNEL